MKRLISIVLSLSMILTLASCSGKTNGNNGNTPNAGASSDYKTSESSAIPETTEAPTTTNEDDAIDDEAWDGLKSIGQIQTENGVFTATITLPKDFVGDDVTQESIDAKAGESYISGKLNEDGSVTYKMTKKQHKAMLDEIVSSFEKSFDEMVKSEDYSFTSIKHNKDFTQFDITISENELGLAESFATIAFYMAGGVYGVFSGKKAEKVIVNYYNTSGKLINTADSSKLGESDD